MQTRSILRQLCRPRPPLTVLAAVAGVCCGMLYGQEPQTPDLPQIPERPQTSPQGDLLATLEQRAGEVRSAYADSVVSIACVSRAAGSGAAGIDALRGRVGLAAALSPQDPSYVAAAYATGLVWDDRGSIITVYSALGNPEEYDYYVWSRGRVARGQLNGLRAKVVAGEPYTNVAALRCLDGQFASGLKPIREVRRLAADSGAASPQAVTSPDPGEFVFRLACAGPASRDGWLSVEHGGVMNVRRSLPSGGSGDASAADRSLIYSHASLFQTSHAAYRDAAGAAMVDLRGRLVGVQVDHREISGEVATFALPIAGSFERVADAVAAGRLADFGFLGIQPGRATQREHGGTVGVAVEDVVEDMPADEAGLQPGDLITHLAGREVEQREAIFREVAAHSPGEEVELSVHRTGDPRSPRNLRVRLTKRYMLTQRPPLSTEREPTWRGARIDAVTALPPEMLFAQMRAFGGFTPTQVVAVDVDLDSPSWAAGLRGGMRVLEVNGIAVDGIDHFRRLTADSDLAHRLTLQLPSGQRVEATVPSVHSSIP